jgi:hypothetical protein
LNVSPGNLISYLPGPFDQLTQDYQEHAEQSVTQLASKDYVMKCAQCFKGPLFNSYQTSRITARNNNIWVNPQDHRKELTFLPPQLTFTA